MTMNELTEQELHNLAMNEVGKTLEQKGWEFLAINSQLNKNPQFVCVDERNQKHFVIVKAILYPENPIDYDMIFMQTLKEHALKFNARFIMLEWALPTLKITNCLLPPLLII